jgi:hypothetical protein
MTIKLIDPWFEAEFYGNIKPNGAFTRQKSIIGAQGLMMWCPCGYGKPEYPVEGARPHMIMIPFINPIGAPVAPDVHGPFHDGRSLRWTRSVEGIVLDALTIQPSINVVGCWHGFITNSEVINA